MFLANLSSRVFLSIWAGFFLELKRANIQTITQKAPFASYQNIQYFLSEAQWDSELLNNKRLQILHATRPTKSCAKGVLALDDTSCRKSGKKTQGAKVQYSSTEDHLINCNVVVLSSYCDEVKRFPVNLRPYLPKEEFDLAEDDPDFKSKIQLAKELVDDTLQKNIQFSDTVFDNWYFSNDFISHLENKYLTWITEADGQRLISYQGKWCPADELVKLIPSIKFTRKVTVPNSQGKMKTFRLYGFETKIKGLRGKKKVVISKGSWDEQDPKKVHIYVTNHRSLSDQEVVLKYALR